MNIYIPTCNSRIYLVEALLYSIRKYWYNFESNKFTIVGYNEPQFTLPSNVIFESLGSDDNVKNWATDLKSYFESVDDKYFVYMNDDCPIVEHIDTRIFNFFLGIINNNTDSKIGRIALTASLVKDFPRHDHRVVQQYGDFDLIEKAQNSKYRLSTQFSIWNKKYLTMYMKENMTPWEYELQNSAMNDGWTILGTNRRYCLDFYHLWRVNGISKSWDFATFSKKKLTDNNEDYNFITNVMNKNGK